MDALVVVLSLVAAGCAAAVAVLLRERVREAARAAVPATPDPRIEALRGALDSQQVRLDRIADALRERAAGDEAVRDGLDRARALLEVSRAREEERRERDDETRTAVRRLETVLAGAGGRGAAGENVVREALNLLPPDMLDPGFQVNGGTVEFALVLPDGKRLPVDSKLSCSDDVAALGVAEGLERRRICDRIEKTVAARAKEVARYLDLSLTTPFAVAAVPDAVYAVLRRAHHEAYRSGVLLVPYSSALPVVLALYRLCARLDPGRSDVGPALADLAAAVDAIERTLENFFERAATMTSNGASQVRVQLGKARGALALAREGADTELPERSLRAVE